MSRWPCALPLLVVLACSRPDPGFDGIGPWHIGKTTMGEGGVRCDPPSTAEPDLHWCYLNPDLTFAEQHATVDLYFRGPDDSARLAEILLAISHCEVEGIDKALTGKLGPAAERHGATFVWKQPTANIVARMPSAPGECEISFLGPGETRRLAALIRRGTGGAPAPAAGPAAAPVP